MTEANYDLILFDADDTLFDFQKSEAVAFNATATRHGIDLNIPNLYPSYKEISFSLWCQLERNEISKDQLRVRRFELLLEKHGLSACAISMSDTYLELLPQHVFLIDDATELCQFLQTHVEIGIVTNGIESVQKKRLYRSGLKDMVSFMVVSEECGFHKPDRRIFDHAIRKAKKSPNKVLVVGDRLETDIVGAANAGLDSCWFNPTNQSLSSDYNPTHTISCLTELQRIICHYGKSEQ